MSVKKMTKRWLLRTVGIIFLILTVVVVIVSVAVRSFYYDGVKEILYSNVNVTVSQLMKLSGDEVADYAAKARSLVENSADKDKFEIMAIGSNGMVSLTSSGFIPDRQIEMPDYREAKGSYLGTGEYLGRIDHENVLAITVMSPTPDNEFSAIRYVASMEKVDRQVMIIILMFIIFGVVIISFALFSGSYFINSIVNPVSEVGNAARKIALGDFNARIEKKYKDEIGDLCDVINYMAAELKSGENVKNDFISSVSHELRTPLTAIKGWGETLENPEGLDPKTYKRGMKVIIGETERLSSMVEELLDFSRMQSGKLTLVKGKMDILAELGEAVIMFDERAKREQISLEYEEPESLSPVFGDKNRLRQVFINIIDNALKYSDSGGKVVVRAEENGGFILISITDTGCGIEQGDLPKIKNKFYKGNKTRRGSGIGLAVADEIVLLHGGTLNLVSQIGFGTKVTISLPVMPKNTVDTEISLPQEGNEANDTTGKA